MNRPAITLDRLLAGIGVSAPEIPIQGLALDSRRLAPGDAFVAVAGQTTHGLSFADRAAAAGALAVLHDSADPPPAALPVPSVAIPQLAQHLPNLARRMWSDPGAALDLIAVTGTNGKTSIAWLLAQALEGAMIGTLGCGRPGGLMPATHTTPDIFSVYRLLDDFRRQGIQTVVMEASSHALAQGRLDGLVFSSVIFTTLGHDHLDYHADRAAYGEAKARLFFEHPSRRQLINLDDAFGQELARRLPDADGLIGYSLSGHAEARVRGRTVATAPGGLKVALELQDGSLQADTELVGQVNAWNVLVVAAELEARGFSLAQIGERLTRLRPVPGRMQPVRGPDGRLAIIDYAHTPDALESALASVRQLAANELWCVFGCGGERDRGKRAMMGRIAERAADRVILTDDNPRHEDGTAIVRDIQSGMQRPQRALVIRDRARAIRHAIAACQPEDVVLIAGKGHENEQIAGDARLPFDDVCVAREALEVAA